MKRRRGLSLGSTLLVVSLIVTLGFSLSGLSVSQLGLARKADNRQQAENMAESVIALGIEKVRANEKFGTTAGSELLKVTAGEATGWLTFDAGHAATEGLLVSTNNLAGTGSTASAEGRPIPAGTVRLVGEGRCGDVVRRVEAFLRAPACPYALASSGRIEALGGLLVGSVKGSDEVPPILADPAANPPRPGDLVANSDLDNAVVLQGQTVITGDLQTSGEVQAANPGSDIWGEVRAHCDPVELPKVDVAGYDPEKTGKPHSSLDAPPEDNPRLSGVVRFTTSQVIPGTLTLDSALVFVNGDLTVKGGVKGRGALVVTGKTRLENGATLDAGNRLTLLGQGSVEILGSGKQSSAFQGLVYTEGDFTVEKITVVGALFARGSVVRLGDCNLLANPQVEKLDLGSPGSTAYVRAPQFVGADQLINCYNAGLIDATELLSRMPYAEMPIEVKRDDDRITLAQADGLNFFEPGSIDSLAPIVVDPADPEAANLAFNYFATKGAHRGDAPLLYGDLITRLLQRLLNGPPLVPNTVPAKEVLGNAVKVKLSGSFEAYSPSDAPRLLSDLVSFAESGGGDLFRFDPSQFLRFEDRVRVSLWRDL